MLASIRKNTNMILDVHLMITEPERFIDRFADAGADILTVHPESTPHVHRVLQQIRSLGLKSGLALNPGTPVEVAINLLEECDLVLIMSVNPGYGGQEFQRVTYRRLATLIEGIQSTNHDVVVEVDGGVGVQNIRELQEAGVDIVVIGSGIFSTDIAPNEAIERLQSLVRLS
jgi:ribulose-phosphate 3-epimerase